MPAITVDNLEYRGQLKYLIATYQVLSSLVVTMNFDQGWHEFNHYALVWRTHSPLLYS
ncbi:Uncharacterised protein [Burkholderia cenocepacia]|nr:hypothetical protein [Burkholderia cepacia]PZX01531.1 hypothetical protein DFS13_107238 [Burkholderia sp. 28_3]RAS51866.1 hypothetical protein DFS07_111117 [Burkholderia cenocepacia]MDP9623612.1 hypothetical protein [Burkholderia cepacia]SOT42107.1 hypothetical protein F01_420153 [Burkholderia cenocepacia]